MQAISISDEKCALLDTRIEEIKKQLRSADKFASEEVSALSVKSVERKLEVFDNKVQFPNFSSEDLYGEYFRYKEEETQSEIVYEGSMDSRGCCRSRFFCFYHSVRAFQAQG